MKPTGTPKMRVQIAITNFLHCEININLLFDMFEDGSEIELKNTSDKSLMKMFRAVKFDKTRYQSQLTPSLNG